MQSLNDFLSLVTGDPVNLNKIGENKAFPGCEEYAIDHLRLTPGFELGDFMKHDTVSVAEEVFVVDVSPPGASPSKAAHAVWRVVLKTGPVALMRLRITGVEDDQTAEIMLEGTGQVIEDPTLEPFLQLSMIEAARHEAFEELKKIALITASLMKGITSLFGDPDQQAAAASTLSEALSFSS